VSLAADTLRRTPLYDRHAAAGAKLVPFAGWEMPVQYEGIRQEHVGVRTGAGLFDVSHMGEMEIAGKGALEAVQHITSNDASKLQVGQIQYSGLTTPAGTFVDDLLVYRFGPSHYLLVINAGNIDKDVPWITARAKEVAPDVGIVNSSSRYALIAIQGPHAEAILQTQTAIDLKAIKYYWFAHGEIAAVRGTVSRTGYTGEDGFEIMIPPAMAPTVWDALLQAGKSHGLIPAGLGARDTLRLEAAMRLHGNDIDESTTVVEADLGWIVGWNKTEFLGRDVLHAQKADGAAKTLIGFEMTERAIARHGHEVFHNGEKVGVVTSGTQTPFLKKAIGMAYVPPTLKAPGTELEIDIRGRKAKAVVVPMPFYKRPKKSV
jgi:aminomethyltransferase